MPLTDAYAGLGSNLDDPQDQLHKAIASLKNLPDTAVSGISSFYKTRPVGGPGHQDDYINAVVRIKTELSARELLGHMQHIEHRQGRARTVHWGPRTLDLDLLLYGTDVINEDDLVVPHPEMHRRGFVLYPLYELSPEIIIPGHGPVTVLLRDLEPTGVVKL